MSKFTRKLTSSVAPIVNTPGVWTVNERTQNSTALVITSIVVCNSGYNELDDTAVGTSGGYLKIKGTGFLSTATVYLNGVLITPTVTSSLELRIVVPTLTVGTYSLIVFNTAAVGAIWAPGLVVSGVPVWSTTTIATANLAVNTQLVVSGDATLVYTLASGSLPPGVTLSSGGLLSGTISPVPTVNTVYNFTVDVKDAQNQNLAQAITFSLSVDYFIAKSLRFRSSASAYLNRTASASISTYTVSMWVKRGTLTSTYQYLFSHPNSGNTDGYGLAFNITTDTLYYYNGTAQATTAAYRDPAAWYHIVFSNNAGSFTLYVNGVSVKTGTATAIPSGAVMNLGRYGYTPGFYFDGEQAEVNFVDGLALAPTAFGATGANSQWLPKAYTGTYGTNGFYLPFTNTTGSSFSSYAGTFDGSTQSISVASNAAFQFTGDFTIECWLYQTASNVGKSFYGCGSSGTTDIQCNIATSSVLSFYSPGGGGSAFGITGTTSLAQNTWYHVAITRSGSTVRLFVNGILDATGTSSATMPSVLSAAYVGSYTTYYGNQYWFAGRISNFRVVKGTAVYTSNFVVPTAPLTAISGTSLLTLQNATIVDNSTNAFTITNNGTVVTSTQTVATPATTIDLTADSSGNGNNWTPNNISLTAGSTYDSLTDVPTLTSETVANYAVLNVVNPKGNSTVSNGNLTEVITTVTGAGRGTTIAVTSGKFYVEATATGGGAMVTSVGITSPSASTYQVYLAGVGYYSNNGNKYISGVASAYGTAWASAGTYTIGMALDVGAGTIQFYLNNVAQGNITLPATPSDGWIFVADWESSSGSVTYNWNYGQQPFTYTAPTGFLPLNTFNIAAGTVTTSGTFTGNASTNGPMVWLNGTPTAMTINGNAVTFGTQADKLANGFKVRSSSASYNTAGSNTYTASTVGAVFKYEDAQGNP